MQSERNSISLIKEQYNESIKSLKDKMGYEISSKSQNYEKMILGYTSTINILEERVRKLETVAHGQNKSLLNENKALRNRLEAYGDEISELRIKVSAPPPPSFPHYKEERLR